MAKSSPQDQCCMGLFASNFPVPLTAVKYDFSISGFAARVTIHQTYKNEETTDLECVYGFPMNDQAGIVGFTVTIDDRVLVSQIKKKDDAFKEYTEAISRGDGAYLLDQSDRSDDTFVMSVGRLPPQKECTVSISYACTLESVTETKIRLIIPMSLSPRYNPAPEAAAKGVVPPEKYQAKVPYMATLTGAIHAVDVIQSVTSPTHPLKVILIGPQEVSVEFGAQQQPLDRDLIVEIEVKNNPEHYVEVEMGSPGQYTAMYTFIPRLKQDSSVNTELIFLVDCSGSMEEEGKIDEAKRAMQIFLRSIPEGCYFNFYRFGSTFESLFLDSELYSADSFSKAKHYTAQTSASLGGTEILAPLQQIYSQPPRTGFSRQLFVLTDGDVSNTAEVIDLVRRNATNTRVFSFGLGQSPSRSLVNGIAMAGNGKSEFIKLGEVLEDKIGRHLNRALQPAVTGAVVTWNFMVNVQQAPTKLPPVFYGDRQLVFAFFDIPDGKPTPSITISYGQSASEVPLRIPTSINLEHPLILSKLAARALINEIEHSPLPGLTGTQQPRLAFGVEPDVVAQDVQSRVTAISLAHGVMSQWVSLVAVEQRSKSERDQASTTMQLREVPVQKMQRFQMGDAQAYSCMPSSARCGMMGSLRKNDPVVSVTRVSIPCGGYDLSELDDRADCIGSVASDGNDCEKKKKSAAKSTSIIGTALHRLRDFRLFASDGNECKKTSGQSTSSGTELHRLLDLQQWDGSWSFSKELENITGISQARLKGLLSREIAVIDETSLATILAIEYIKEKFNDHASVWQAIVKKGVFFLAKHLDSTDLTNFSAQVTRLITNG